MRNNNKDIQFRQKFNFCSLPCLVLLHMKILLGRKQFPTLLCILKIGNEHEKGFQTQLRELKRNCISYLIIENGGDIKGPGRKDDKTPAEKPFTY